MFKRGRHLLEEDDIEALMSLGLTLVQSKVYLALAKSGCATTQSITELSNVPRQDIYRILTQLQELSLVEKIVSKPVRFLAIPVQEAFTILLSRKKEEYIQSKQKGSRFLRKFESDEQNLVEVREYQFFMVKGKEALLRILTEKLTETSRSADIATTHERLMQKMNHFGILYNKKLKSGVKFRIITDHPQKLNKFSEDLGIFKNQNFELKYVHKPLRANVGIFDKKSALASTHTGQALLNSPVICTNNPAFIAMFEEYFEAAWKTAKSFR